MEAVPDGEAVEIDMVHDVAAPELRTRCVSTCQR